MQLHELQPTHTPAGKKTRVGRGGKRGTTSGRGTKGQRSRTGHRIRPAERDFIQRLPKLRGIKNKPLKFPAHIVRVGDLGKISGGTVNHERLRAAGLVKSRRDERIKILADGEIKTPLTIEGIEVSRGARKKIEAAGGKIK